MGPTQWLVVGEADTTVTVCWGGLGTAPTCSKAFILTISSFVNCSTSQGRSISVAKSGNAVAGVACKVDGCVEGAGSALTLQTTLHAVQVLGLLFSERHT